ncbi:Histone acetyltransferase kat7 [Cotesia glomerata]|uniref:Histone acetyltransferase n=1 Tax=Cotesia glomerata TaxID=32391 RepID=A0AAV7IG92_COTGL|nr:Histone acetyltransferase kat7 [Cotesia glomerata]
MREPRGFASLQFLGVTRWNDRSTKHQGQTSHPLPVTDLFFTLIITVPIHNSCYLLTRVEKKIGSPEKPLSDLGLISYRSYWKDVLLQYLCHFGGKELSVKDISKEMAIETYDIVSTLQALGMMKYWKGKHIILKKQDVIDDYKERVKRRGPVYKEIDPECLKWNPFQPPKTSSTSN